MGYANVSLVYARWGHLADRPFRLLTFMALRTRDEDDPPLFWEGREAMAAALGRMVPDEPLRNDRTPRAEDFRRLRRNDFEAVKTTIRALTAAGAVRLDNGGYRGATAVYSLHLGCGKGKAEPVERGRTSLSMGKAEPVERGRTSLPPTEEPPTGVQDEDTKTKPRSPHVGNSPGAEEIDFGKAKAILDSLPDKGAELLSQVRAIGGFENRHIAAARIHLAGRSAS
jgi:hypothetical protein